MKRLFSLFAAALFAVAALSPASARGAKTWEETQEYGRPTFIGVDTEFGAAVGGVAFNTRRATKVELTVEDTAAPTTGFTVEHQGRDLGSYCTSTPGPIDIAVAPHQELRVNLFAGVCEGDPSFITTGLVRARFSRS